MPQALTLGKLKRTMSTPHILEALPSSPLTNLNPKMTNGFISMATKPTPLRFTSSPSQRGLMDRFLAMRGKILNSQSNGDSDCNQILPITPICLNQKSIKTFSHSLDVKIGPNDEAKKLPMRRGYVPVEQKIQKELNEMKERENELRLVSILNDTITESSTILTIIMNNYI